ncbi:MAG: hypothetical protein R3F43_02720 [bacterium]
MDEAPTTDEALLVSASAPPSASRPATRSPPRSQDDRALISAATAGAAFAIAPRNPLRIKDFDATLHASTGWRLQHDLDRVRRPLPPPRLGCARVGRPSATAAPASSATDVFAPASPAAIDTEFKARRRRPARHPAPRESQEVEAFAVVDGEAPAEASTWPLAGHPHRLGRLRPGGP